MKKYILLIALLFCVHIASAQSANSIEEGIQKGAENIKYLDIRFDKGNIVDLSKLKLFVNLEKLNVYGADKFYEQLFDLSRLESLSFRVSKNPIEIPDNINKLKFLKDFYVDKTAFISKYLYNLTLLEHLNLSKITSATIDEKINNLENLKLLYLSGNYKIDIPKLSFKKLESLHLEIFDSTHFPDISTLTNLTTLFIKSNSIKKLPESLSLATNLYNLSVDAPIQELNNNITNLQSLAYIKLSNTNLQDLPLNLSVLSGLTSLKIIGADFKTIPKVLENCKKLQELKINNTKIEDISNVSWLNYSKYLNGIDLSDNPISKLPTSLPPNLTTVYLNKTKISTIPDEWILSNRVDNKKLESIFLYKTNISNDEWQKIDKKVTNKTSIEKDFDIRLE